jgi:Domain of unknown function (DUF4329)
MSKPFSNADAAAIEAIQKINPLSIANKWEYAGRIYQKNDGKFYYTEAKTQKDPNNSDPGAKLLSSDVKKNVGTYHTHGGAFDETDEFFSPQDKVKATFGKEISYLGTPLQRILKYIPVDLLTAEQQKDNPVGLIEALISVFTLREVTIVGNPNNQD